MRTKMTFAQILHSVQRQNLVALKDRAFAANRIAKLTLGRSRRAAYSVKDKSISRLLSFGEARILRLYGRPTGVRFRSSGQLHLRAAKYLDNDARHSATPITAKELATKPAVYADN